MDYIEQLKKDGVILEENEIVRFKGDQSDMLYLKYLCASKGVSNIKEFFVGFPEDPIMNLHHKLVEGTFLKDFQEYYIHTGFDKREEIDGKTGKKFIVGAEVNLPPGEHTVLLISPETTEEFYLGARNSVRFRVNIEWMKEGFLTQVKFKKEEDKEKFQDRLNALMGKLDFLGYKILLKDEISRNNEGTEFSKQGKLSEAIECFDKAIEINPAFELPWANKAGAFLNLKKYDEALECVNKAVELHPNWFEALKLKGVILINLKRNEEALECLEKATNINPEDWSVWDNKGRALFNLARYDGAINCFDKALKFNPGNNEVLNLKGLSLFHLGKFDEALNCFDETLKIKPDFVPALLAKGEILLNKNDYNQALNCFDIILRKESHNIHALFLKGLALSKLALYEDAIDCCDKILKIDRNIGAGWYNKACFEAKIGNSDNALECLRKAIEIDRRFVEEAKNEEDLAILRNDDRFLSLIQEKQPRSAKNG